MANLIVSTTICLLLIFTVNCQRVKVNFMDYNAVEWQALEVTVKNVITNKINDYCSTSNCQTASNNISTVTFTGSKGTYEIDGRYAVVYISAKTANSEALSAEVLEQFMIARRAEIVTAANVNIAYVNGKLVYPARDHTDNYVIISISTTVTIALLVLNLVLTKKRNDEIKLALVNGKKEIYASKEENSPKKERLTQSEESMPLKPMDEEIEEEEDIDSVPGFPSAADDPMLSTSESMYNGVRTNPNLKLTQV